MLRLPAWYTFLGAALLALLALACASETTPQPAVSPMGQSGLPEAVITFLTKDGQRKSLTVELTCTEADRQRGLMFRASLPEDRGMLFVLGEGARGFWMKDTRIPLTAAFIDRQGTVVHLEDMQPETTDIHNSPRPYYYGLEANQGWFQRNGIAVGDKVNLPWPYEPPPAVLPGCQTR
ncbi:MAG TPA: DUF192 domain-containing protein [Dehalococcoidia bacterium]|nr:DUF192 domain-containing protein [Dehalococcoidia bacterium]